MQNNLREQTQTTLKSLTPREEKVLKMRFGVGGGSEHTLEEVGKQFDVTRERIRQIEQKALLKLRRAVAYWANVDVSMLTEDDVIEAFCGAGRRLGEDQEAERLEAEREHARGRLRSSGGTTHVSVCDAEGNAANPGNHVRLVGYDNYAQSQGTALVIFRGKPV